MERGVDGCVGCCWGRHTETCTTATHDGHVCLVTIAWPYRAQPRERCRGHTVSCYPSQLQCSMLHVVHVQDE